ncbi:MAG: sulfatase-like hydrolase/transferase [Deltaproteobacteria bacterium]|nr:sulfatase-like hydrolase/transferase [Deltaproteobacteria bacterium]
MATRAAVTVAASGAAAAGLVTAAGLGTLTNPGAFGVWLDSTAAVSAVTVLSVATPFAILALRTDPRGTLSNLIGPGPPRRKRSRWWWLALLSTLPPITYALTRVLVGESTDVPHEVAASAAGFVGGLLVWSVNQVLPRRVPRIPELGAAPVAWLLVLIATAAWAGPLLALGEVVRAWMLPPLLLLWVAAILVTAAPPRGRGARWGVVAGAVITVAVIASILPRADLRVLANPAGRTARSTLFGLADRDEDGYSSLFGGQDCNDHDPAVHPWAPEIAGNGVDDNCLGGELTAVPPLPRTTPTRSPSATPYDVVLLSIDAWRGDAWSRELTPALHAYGQGGRYFSRAFAPSSYTKLSLLSIFTGWPPSDFDRANSLTGFDRSLADIMGSLGWRTMAMHSVPNMDQGVLLGFSETQTRQTADYYSEHAPGLVADALEWLQEPASQPRLLWLHLLDPHAYYLPHEGFEHLGNGRRGRYLQEVAFTDQSVAPLLEWLDRPEVAARTVVVIFADHGEYMGERGLVRHPNYLHQPTTHVPLVVRAPGLGAGVEQTPVSLLDILPTVLELTGVDGVQPRGGESLLRPRPERTLVAEVRGTHKPQSIAARTGRWLLHCGDGTEPCELFDTETDPACEFDLAYDHPERTAAMRQELGRQLDPLRSTGWAEARRHAFEAYRRQRLMGR